VGVRGELRDGYLVLFLGCKDVYGNKIVFPARMPSYRGDSFAICTGEEYVEFMSSADFTLIVDKKQRIRFYF
jgi:hypothetical protein